MSKRKLLWGEKTLIQKILFFKSFYVEVPLYGDDIVAFYYSGPKDDDNRTFCSYRVEKNLERKLLERAIKYQGGTYENPGGEGCRHKLYPISRFDEEAKPFLTKKEIKEIFG